MISRIHIFVNEQNVRILFQWFFSIKFMSARLSLLSYELWDWKIPRINFRSSSMHQPSFSCIPTLVYTWDHFKLKNLRKIKKSIILHFNDYWQSIDRYILFLTSNTWRRHVSGVFDVIKSNFIRLESGFYGGSNFFT